MAPSCPVDRRPFSKVYRWDKNLNCVQVSVVLTRFFLCQRLRWFTDVIPLKQNCAASYGVLTLVNLQSLKSIFITIMCLSNEIRDFFVTFCQIHFIVCYFQETNHGFCEGTITKMMWLASNWSYILLILFIVLCFCVWFYALQQHVPTTVSLIDWGSLKSPIFVHRYYMLDRRSADENILLVM